MHFCPVAFSIKELTFASFSIGEALSSLLTIMSQSSLIVMLAVAAPSKPRLSLLYCMISSKFPIGDD
jgi:hypothetical protein